HAVAGRVVLIAAGLPSCNPQPENLMHASLQGKSLPVVLHDHPPVDKPDRLPLRQGWSTADGAPAAGVQPESAPGLPRAPRYRVRTEGGTGIIHAVNERALRDARRAVRGAHRQP